jgi:hypothetical protein
MALISEWMEQCGKKVLDDAGIVREAIYHQLRRLLAVWIVGSEEARMKRWPPSAAQTARTVFPYAAFTKTQRRQDAREGIK